MAETMFDFSAATTPTPDMSSAIASTNTASMYENLLKVGKEVASLGKEYYTDEAKMLKLQEAHTKALQDPVFKTQGYLDAVKDFTEITDTYKNNPEISVNKITDKVREADPTNEAYYKGYTEHLKTKIEPLVKEVIEKQEGQGATNISYIVTDELIRTEGKATFDVPALALAHNITNKGGNIGVIKGYGQYFQRLVDNINPVTDSILDVAKLETTIKQVEANLENNYQYGNKNPDVAHAVEIQKSATNSLISDKKEAIKSYAISTINAFENPSGKVDEQFNGDFPPMKLFENYYEGNAKKEYDAMQAKVKQNLIDRKGILQSPTEATNPELDNQMSEKGTKERQQYVFSALSNSVMSGDIKTFNTLALQNQKEAKQYLEAWYQNATTDFNSDKQIAAIEMFRGLFNTQQGAEVFKTMSPEHYTTMDSMLKYAQILPQKNINGKLVPDYIGAMEKVNEAYRRDPKGLAIDKEFHDKIISDITEERYGPLTPILRGYYEINGRLGSKFSDIKNSLQMKQLKSNFYKDEKTELELVAPNGWSTAVNKQFLANHVMTELNQSRYKGLDKSTVFIQDNGNGHYDVKSKGGITLLTSENGNLFKVFHREKFYKEVETFTDKNLQDTKAVVKTVSTLSPDALKGAYQKFNTTVYSPVLGTNGPKINMTVMATGINSFGTYLEKVTGRRGLRDLLIETSMAESDLGSKNVFGTKVVGKGNGLFQITEQTYKETMHNGNTKDYQLVLSAVNKYINGSKTPDMPNYVDIRRVPYEQAIKSPIYSTAAASLVYMYKEQAIGRRVNVSDQMERARFWKKYYNTYSDTHNSGPSYYMQKAQGVPVLRNQQSNNIAPIAMIVP